MKRHSSEAFRGILGAFYQAHRRAHLLVRPAGPKAVSQVVQNRFKSSTRTLHRTAVREKSKVLNYFLKVLKYFSKLLNYFPKVLDFLPRQGLGSRFTVLQGPPTPAPPFHLSPCGISLTVAQIAARA